MPHNFDKLDVNILTMLAGNARKPYLEISRECGVSVTCCGKFTENNMT